MWAAGGGTAAMTTTTVYLVDDNDGFRDSTAWLLETAGFDVHAFPGGKAFLAAWPVADAGEQQCLISDIRMPEMSGLQLQEELLRRNITLPLIFVTAHGDVPLAVEAMRKGAANFLEKPFGDEALIEAVHLAMRQPAPTDPAEAPAEPDPDAQNRLLRLSPRERQVLELVIASKSNKIIADVLGISIKTVELHRANMMTKLDVRSLPELMKVALGHG